MPFDRTYMIYYLSNYVFILHSFRDIIAYFQKFKDVTWPWLRLCKEQFVIPMLNHCMVNQCTKYEVCSNSHSGDILGVTEDLNGSRDYNHAPFVCGLGLAMIKLFTKFEISTFTYTKIWKATKIQKLGWFGPKLWGLGVTQGHRQHSHPIEHMW